ncbi:MAG: argininosuccinate lyase [Spirochaetes bacterium]|nr:MAG: argininosuccinate lyase [Spirochaetota bacterium]
MSKLWEKGDHLDSRVEAFTVGEDYILDRDLVPADCVASMAHAVMLASIGILTEEELHKIKSSLVGIIKAHEMGKFEIPPFDEDCHTAIENQLAHETGETGKKIHTARSRNDQVIAALRIYGRAALLKIQNAVVDLSESLVRFANEHKLVPVPGRTHMQPAMPSSLGLWAGSFAEELLDDLMLIRTAYELNNQCPLGSAASYGVPLPINREMVSGLLGFGKLQSNVLYVNNSRGKIESIILDALDQIGLTASKLAQDIILFSLPEFGYFELDTRLCTGSSIMPQKKNPDVLELVRAKSVTLHSYATRVKGIIRSLPSGYNRDFQETKAPFLKGLKMGKAIAHIMKISVDNIAVNEDRCREAFTPEIYAADAAFELVQKGSSFRDAYRKVGKSLGELERLDPAEAIKKRTSTGMSGNLCLDRVNKEIIEVRNQIQAEERRIEKAINNLMGFSVEII